MADSAATQVEEVDPQLGCRVEATTGTATQPVVLLARSADLHSEDVPGRRNSSELGIQQEGLDPLKLLQLPEHATRSNGFFAGDRKDITTGVVACGGAGGDAIGWQSRESGRGCSSGSRGRSHDVDGFWISELFRSCSVGASDLRQQGDKRKLWTCDFLPLPPIDPNYPLPLN
jgi:hypothetical protein